MGKVVWNSKRIESFVYSIHRIIDSNRLFLLAKAAIWRFCKEGDMTGLYKKLMISSIILLFLAAVSSTSAIAANDGDTPEDITAHAMAWDALLVRPLGVVAIIVGSTGFIITWPLAALGGNVHVTFEKLIVEPVSFTFQRGLGDF